MKASKIDTALCFPRPIWVVHFEAFEAINEALRREFDAVDWDALAAEASRRFGADHTYSEDRFVALEQAPTMGVVLEQFIDACRRIIEGLKWDVSGKELVLTSFWAHPTWPGERTDAHRHIPALLSGVYYVDVPPESGNIVFIDDNPHAAYQPPLFPGAENYLGGRSLEIDAKEGTMLIFPSWLDHKVLRNRSDRRRMSLSFNASLVDSR